MESYTLSQLTRMNSTTKWNGRIILPVSYSDSTTFHIYPTWEADLDGRYWAAIRSGRTITSTLKSQYNLM